MRFFVLWRGNALVCPCLDVYLWPVSDQIATSGTPAQCRYSANPKEHPAMQVTLGHHDWRVLRAVVRAKGKPVHGRILRLDMSRKTKDGTFLVRLVENGLLVVSRAADDPFEATYVLTPPGKEAAEFGVYDVVWEDLKTRESRNVEQKTKG